MKQLFSFCTLLLVTTFAFAQNVGIGTTTPQSKLSVGATSQFQVDSIGNIKKINNVPTSFPASQGSNGQVLTNDGNGALSWSAYPNFDYAVFIEQRSSGGASADSSNTITIGLANTWYARCLNTTQAINGTSITRTNSVITLQSGTYRIKALIPITNCGTTKTRLKNITDIVTALVGDNNGGSPSTIDGIISISSAKSFVIEHWTTSTCTFGVGISVPGVPEVYTRIVIEKLK